MERGGGREIFDADGREAAVVVDTGVWSDFFAHAHTPQVDRLHELIDAGAPIAVTDIVLYELLAGAREDAPALERALRAFIVLRLESIDDFVLAASLRRAAWGGRGATSDALRYLVAAVCIRTGTPILHADAELDRLAGCSALRVFE
ncbi:MAG: PIN domain-containing protein [Solirubrobacteraceae bacterium]